MSHSANNDHTHPNHEAILDLLPAYALGVLDEAESAQVAGHLAGCADCAEELRAYEEATAALIAATAPPISALPDLEQRLMQRAAKRTQKIADPRPSLPDRVLGSRALRWAIPAIALAAVLLIVALSVQPARAPIHIHLAGTDAAPDASGTLTITSSQVATLSVADLPPLDETQQYQLWLVRPDGTRDSGAVFSVAPDGSAEVPVTLARSPDTYIRFGITVEPAGGSPGPTGPGVLRSDS